MQGLMTYMTRLEGDVSEKGCQGEPFFIIEYFLVIR